MAQLIIVEGPNRGKTFELGKKETLGRSESSSIVLNDRRVSESHAEIRLRKNGYEIVNLDHTKSLLVNGEVFKQTRLQHGDWITIADTTLVFSEDSEPRKPVDVQAIDTDDLVRSQIQARRKQFEDAESVIESLDRTSEADSRLKTLYRLAQKLSMQMELNKLIEKLADECIDLFKADRTTVMLTMDEDGRKVRPIVTRHREGDKETDAETTVSRTIIKEVFNLKEAILCTDTHDDARFLSGQSIVDQNLRAFICAPFLSQGRITGILQIDSSREHSLSEEDLELASAVAQFASVLIENSKAYRKRQEYNQTLFHLSRATKRISSFLDRDRILKEVVSLATRILSCSKASVVLKHPETGRLKLESVQGMTKEVWGRIKGSEIGERFCKRVIEEAKSLIVPDVRELGLEPNPRYSSVSCLIVPIIAGDQQQDQNGGAEVLGAVCVADKSSGGAFSGTDQKVLDILAAHCAIALKNAELYEKATVDVLTKVFVRRYFFQKLVDELKNAEKRKTELSLLMIDLDNFGMVNKQYGVQAGDQVLRTVGATLKKCVRPAEDTVARYGGEEFAVILPGAGIESAAKIAERIRSAVEAEPMVVSTEGEDTLELRKTASIGVAEFVPGDLRDALIKRADTAMRWAKKQGKNRFEKWDKSLPRKLRGMGDEGDDEKHGESDDVS
ncbi:MAG: diguanylate cyclase [Planctomycetota bacterium]